MLAVPPPAAAPNAGQQQQQQSTTATNSNSNGGPGGSSISSKEARIHARKLRIEAARLAKMKPDKIDESDTRRRPKVEAEKKDAGKARAQMSASNKKIDSIKLSTTELVTNIRVGIVARESQRRSDDLKKQDIWSTKKQQDTVKSSAMHESISSQWSTILKNKNPYDLNELLTTQKEACDSLMASKNRLINEYMVELKGKDDDYVKELKRQAEEIDTLIERMEEQYRNLQTTLKEELEHIEKAFIEERTELIETNMKEAESLFSQRRDNEGKYLEERADRIEDHAKQLEALRVRDAEEYNLVKIKLETDVQVLEQQLQQMRATYQLNTEKLEYNFQVLKKREEENASILSTQKRKITRLTDHLNLLKTKMTRQEKQYQQEYVSLTDDYKRILDQYKELQKKFRHFQVSDETKYNEIWGMNQEDTGELMRKVLAADRNYCRTTVGDEVGRACGRFVPNSESRCFKRRGKKAGAGGGGGGGGGFGDDESVARVMTGDQEADRSGESLAAKFKETKLGNASAGYSKTMKKMLELLCNEAGFLVEEKLQKLLAPLHRDEQSLMKLDSIFKALGVETVEDIEKLTSFFVAREALNNNNAGGTGEISASHGTALIHPNDVIRAIRRFVEDHRSEKSNGGVRTRIRLRDDDTDAEDEINHQDGSESEGEAMRNGAPSKSKTSQQQQYWERMANVIDDKSYRVWTYNALLTERYQLTQEIDAVRSQSEELKGLLRQYMAAKVNDELQIPPTQIMWHAAGGAENDNNLLG
ncbi:sperm tail-domain-containing protein [Obelidium mucronatum]|nr:sperm tail-domain-containing protein [Obelidium mucronatum]